MIIHVDMSNRYNQSRYSVVACVSVDFDSKENHLHRKGIVITEPLRSSLLKEYSNINLHTAFILLLIKDYQEIKKLIICSDVNPVHKVIFNLQDVRKDLLGKLKSIEELREEIGDKTYKSAADAFARNIKRNFPKKANRHRAKKYFLDGSVIIIDKDFDSNYNLLLSYLKKLKKSK